MPGVFSVTDKESCRQVFLDIERGYTPDFQALLNYFKSFGEATIFGYNALTLGGLEELQIGESKEFIQSLRSARDKSVNEIIKVIVEEAALLK
jgi:hypothetical protein